MKTAEVQALTSYGNVLEGLALGHGTTVLLTWSQPATLQSASKVDTEFKSSIKDNLSEFKALKYLLPQVLYVIVPPTIKAAARYPSCPKKRNTRAVKSSICRDTTHSFGGKNLIQPDF